MRRFAARLCAPGCSLSLAPPPTSSALQLVAAASAASRTAASAAARSAASALTAASAAAARSALTAASATSRAALATASRLPSPADWRPRPLSEASAACSALLHATVRTPHHCFTAAGCFTVALPAPFKGAPVLVLTPGYGSGSGLWAPNLDALSAHFQVFAVDWRGTGGSERPPFAATTVAEAEAFFVTGLDAWKEAVLGPAPPPFTLVGHSLGGYLSAAFALAHPTAVAHLVLVSPAGMPNESGARVRAARERHWAVEAVARAWEGGVTPGSIVRALGPLGERFTLGVMARRFGLQGEEGARELLGKYVYAITAAQGGSGEKALSVLLEFGAHAKSPMGPRLVKAAARKGSVPFATSLLYGSHDWMDVKGGEAVAGALRDAGVDAAFAVVQGAGHHLYLEQPARFEDALLSRALPLAKRARV